MPSTNLRADLTTFLGRDAELASLDALLRDGVRLITLVGPGGAGKTRLARAFGLRLVDAAPEAATLAGVWFCDLTDCLDADAALEVIAANVEGGLPLRDARFASLAEALGALGPTVLLLDNLEQLDPTFVAVVGRLLVEVPALTILATSRTPLRAPNEQLLEVGPVPEEIALELLVDRARTRRPGYAPDPRERAALVDVVDGIDRLPLAIELAAPLLAVMDADVLRDRLSRRFELLASSAPAADPRHASLHGVLASMWEPLPEPMREALIHLSVCAGGFDYPTAEAMIESGGSEAALITALADYSLVRRWTTSAGRVRLGLYVSVRAFARQQASAETLAACRRRHRAYFAREAAPRAARVVRYTHSPRDGRWLAQERENLRAALVLAPDETLSTDGLRDLLECAAALLRETRIHHSVRELGALARPVFDALGAFVAGASADALLAESGATPQDSTLLEGLAEALPTCVGPLFDALLSVAQGIAEGGQSEHGEALLQRCRRLAGLAGDRVRAAQAELELSFMWRRLRGRQDDAREIARRAAAVFAAEEETALELMALAAVALVDITVGNEETARPLLEEAIERARDLGAERMVGAFRRHISILHLSDCDLHATRDHLASALDVERRFADVASEATTLNAMATVVMRLGELDVARDLAERAKHLHTRLGQRMPATVSWALLARIAIGEGRLREATDCLLRAETVMPPTSTGRVRDRVTESRALIAIIEHDLDGARRAFDQISGPSLKTAVPESQIERCLMRLELARLRQNEDALADARAAIRDLPELDHVEYTGLLELARVYAEWTEGAPLQAIQTAMVPQLSGPWLVLDLSIRVRFWLDRLFRAFSPEARERVFLDALPFDPAAGPQRLVVSIDGLRIWMWHGENTKTIDFGRRNLLGRVFGRLVDAAVADEGTVDADALLDAGWPGEKMQPEAAANRLHKCLSDLRKQGLRDVIETLEEGYLIAPAIEVVRLPADFAEWWRRRREEREEILKVSGTFQPVSV